MNRVQEIEKIVEAYREYPKDFQNAVERILTGDVITLNYKRENAYINYYVGNNTEEVEWADALALTSFRFIEIESGNLETGEDHYISSFIVKNTNELRSTKSIIKFNL